MAWPRSTCPLIAASSACRVINDANIHCPAGPCVACCREGVLASNRCVAKLWRFVPEARLRHDVCNVAGLEIPAICFADVNARFSCRDEIGFILGLPVARQAIAQQSGERGKEPALRSRLKPVIPHHVQQPRREHDFAIFPAFTRCPAGYCVAMSREGDRHGSTWINMRSLSISLTFRLQTSDARRPAP